MDLCDKITRKHKEATPLDKYLEQVIRKADQLARAMVRRYGRPLADRDDLRNELLLDLITRIPKYRPAKGHFLAFVRIVFANQARVLARRYYREQALFIQTPEVSSRVPQTSPNAIHKQGDRQPFEISDPEDGFAEVDLRLSLERGLAILTPADRSLVGWLANHSPTMASQVLSLGRATIHRHRREIERRMAMLGVAA